MSRRHPQAAKWPSGISASCPTPAKGGLGMTLVLALALGSCGKKDEAPDALAEGTVVGPELGTWTAIPEVASVPARNGHDAYWVGGRMIVAFQHAYDPATGSWKDVAASGAPPCNDEGTVVGATLYATCASKLHAYDPATDTWTVVGIAGLPTPASLLTLGEKLVVVARTEHGIFDLATKAYTKLPTLDAAVAGNDRRTIVVGEHLVVWGGARSEASTYTMPVTGATLKVGDAAWKPMTTTGAPSGRTNHTALAAGARLIVWGGHGILGAQGEEGLELYRRDGGLYDPVADAWTPISAENAPLGRADHVSSWTGTKLVVWGGGPILRVLPDGAAYDPAAATWQPVTAAGAPGLRREASGVWTGSSLIVWGGRDNGGEGASVRHADGGVLTP